MSRRYAVVLELHEDLGELTADRLWRALARDFPYALSSAIAVHEVRELEQVSDALVEGFRNLIPGGDDAKAAFDAGKAEAIFRRELEGRRGR